MDRGAMIQMALAWIAILLLFTVSLVYIFIKENDKDKVQHSSGEANAEKSANKFIRGIDEKHIAWAEGEVHERSGGELQVNKHSNRNGGVRKNIKPGPRNNKIKNKKRNGHNKSRAVKNA